MSKTLNGSCHCKAVQWTVTLKEDQMNHIACHCNACKSLGDTAFSLNQIIPKSAFSYTKGEDKVKDYVYTGDSGKAVHCYFCSTCTASPVHWQEVNGPDTLILRTALLPDAKEWKVSAAIYGKDKYEWEPEIAKTFELLPPS